MAGSSSISDNATAPKAKLARGKLWCFRLLAALGIPLALAALLELALRVGGVGYPTGFLLPETHHGREVFVPNNRFAWRFFGRELARWPVPFALPRTKPTGTVRIFLFGESAAKGEPQSEFGLARLLQVMLSLKHPEARFEVVNTALTAINSHAILPIARDCTRADGDVWVIYMGNNEVVGPFGAGTVFGGQAPPLPLVRATLALQATRAGQALAAATDWFQPAPRDDAVWGGMTLFLDQQVRADDPRMSGVYHHFARNLDDIIRTGTRHGAGIVLSTVAVNLRDCPPFASAHRDGLSEAEKAEWQRLYDLGSAAQDHQQAAEAAEHFRAASRIDDRFAELRFRRGQCALTLGETTAAQTEFQAARDLDTLRFRCDTRLNELIRQAATNSSGAAVRLVDAERIFAEHSPAGLPGEELFFEHVHLNFDGNWLLARVIAEEVEKELEARRPNFRASGTNWPSVAACARQLGRTEWHQVAAWNSIIATLNDPPFTGQMEHARQLHRYEAELGKLAPAMQPAGIHAAVRACAEASEGLPDDPVLQKQLAILKRAAGDLAGAEAAARRELELLPNDAEGWSLLGSVLARENQLTEAATAFRRGFQLGPQGVKSSLELASALTSLGRTDEAIAEYQRILRLKPRCVPAWLQLGQVMEKLGRKAEADAHYRNALTNRSQRLPELIELAGFFQGRGALAEVAEIYQDAVRLNPHDAVLRLGLARSLASQGRFELAEPHTAEAVRLAPEFVEARLLHGIVLWRRGAAAAAFQEFQEALRLRPESVDARVNLGLVLAQTGRGPEALTMFQEVLARSPTNAVALKYVQSRGGAAVGPPAGKPETQN